ncbi:Putative sensor [Streptomyces zhaozhouensis]|uniref:Sensor n=1 Tax=Streptomyces zhaozhouensis TaxID=1300267 RepID=A0A286DVG1_9ACTN|nr:sensor domain-containing protein [Streptomyces zhaozhouensis]SOD62626.1 Putative sensor [Streptomyces zhaozhouensis]
MATDTLGRTTLDEGRNGIPAARRDAPAEGRVAALLKAPWRGLGIALAIVFVSVPLFALTLVSIGLIPIGIGLYTTPVLMTWMRDFADWRKSLVAEWAGLPVPEPRRAQWAEDAGAPRRTMVLMADPASWRQLWWLLVDTTAGLTVALLPFAMIAQAGYGYVLAAGVWESINDAGGSNWYGFIKIEDQDAANQAALLGSGLLVVAILIAGVVLRGNLRLTRLLIGRS